MKIENRWIRFKRELPSLIYLCIIQTYLNFTFPVFVRLGKPLNIFYPAFLSLLCIFIEIYFFVFEDKLFTIITQEHYDNAPMPLRDNLKKAERFFLIIVLQIVFFFLWYYDFYKMHSVYYFIYYFHGIIGIYLMVRAIKRSQIINPNEIDKH